MVSNSAKSPKHVPDQFRESAENKEYTLFCSVSVFWGHFTASMFHSPWKNKLISNRKWVLRSRVLRNRKWHCTGSASQISRAATCLGTPQIDRSLKFVSLTALVHFCSGTQTDHSTALTITTAMRCRHRNLAVSKSIVCKAYRAVYRFEKMLWSCSHLYLLKILLVPTQRGAELHNWAKKYTWILCYIFCLIYIIDLIHLYPDSWLSLDC